MAHEKITYSTVTASDYDGAAPTCVINGSEPWYINSLGNFNSWIAFDLGSVKSVSYIGMKKFLHTYHGFPANFTIQSSSNDSTWTTRGTWSGFNGYEMNMDVTNFDVTTTSARYWRINITGAMYIGSNYTTRILLVEFWGTQLPPYPTYNQISNRSETNILCFIDGCNGNQIDISTSGNGRQFNFKDLT